jgi:3'-5' exoribonuclease
MDGRNFYRPTGDKTKGDLSEDNDWF